VEFSGIAGVLDVENSIDVEWSRYQQAFFFFQAYLKQLIEILGKSDCVSSGV
jgi:hypothetical protein